MQKMHDRKNIGKIVLNPEMEPKPKPATPAKGKAKGSDKEEKKKDEEKKEDENAVNDAEQAAAGMAPCATLWHTDWTEHDWRWCCRRRPIWHVYVLGGVWKKEKS